MFDIYNFLQADGQAQLDAAGLGNVRLTIGFFRFGDHLWCEARLTGGSTTDREKARRLLPFSEEA